METAARESLQGRTGGKNPSTDVTIRRCRDGFQSPLSGEPYALKGARTVRRGEAGKQPDCAPPLTLRASPIRGKYYYLYMIVDIFSRYIVGWEIHEEENAQYAKTLVQKAYLKEAIWKNGTPLVLHSDNGSPMNEGLHVQSYAGKTPPVS